MEEIGILRCNIGIVYYNTKEYDKALEYFSNALNIKEKVLGAEHPQTATSYNNIGFVYYNQKEYYKALEYHLKALEIQEKVLGKEHPDTMQTKKFIEESRRVLTEEKKFYIFEYL